ncbi:MAG: transcriptional repressor [Oscillospiraceae bacterium]|nr:transcriptional repressor [Oscillospiraceae bacterium]
MPKYVTRQRRSLLGYLACHADESLSAQQIADELSESGVSVSSVYRNLQELETEGKVRRVTRPGSRETYYQYAAAEGCRACLHLSCKKCGKTFHMGMLTADALVNRVAQEERFQIDREDTVIYGVCGNCRQAGGPARSPSVSS